LHKVFDRMSKSHCFSFVLVQISALQLTMFEVETEALIFLTSVFSQNMQVLTFNMIYMLHGDFNISESVIFG
jgi:hypothetical protein